MALNVAALAGDILLASGAEIFRVEETINRIAHAYGIDSCDPFVLSSGFFLTADSNSDQNFAWVRHIPLSATRLDRVTAVNQLSREIEHGFYTPEEAYQKLQDIQQMPAKRNLCQILASGVGSGCFCYLFGGDPVDCIVAFIAGLLLYVYLLCVVKGQISKIATNISGGMFVTFIAVLIYQLGLGHHLSEIIIGSIITGSRCGVYEWHPRYRRPGLYCRCGPHAGRTACHVQYRNGRRSCNDRVSPFCGRCDSSIIRNFLCL